jgi:membrane protease YdiL (CAAX protease family)
VGVKYRFIVNAVFSRTRVLAVYAAVLGVCAAVAVTFGRNPLVTTPWLDLDAASRAMLSAALGVVVGVVMIGATRAMMNRAAWARALHADLRPVVRDADDATLFAVAVASGVGEEVLFRGLLVPAIGIVLSSIVFGAVHQVRGRARWGWMLWAALTGLLFAIVFQLTGNLLGAVIGHALVNAVNLRVLRDVEPRTSSPAIQPRPRRLGGLLLSSRAPRSR